MLRMVICFWKQQQRHGGFVAAASTLFYHPFAALYPKPSLLVIPERNVPNFHHLKCPLLKPCVFPRWAATLSSGDPWFFSLPLHPRAEINSCFCIFTHSASNKAACLQRGATAQLLHQKPKKKRRKLTPFESLTQFLSKVQVAHRVAHILQEMEWNVGAEKAIRGLKVEWDTLMVVQVLRYYPLKVEVAWRFFCWLRGVKGYKHNPYTYNIMLEIFGRLRNIDRIQDLLREMGADGCPMNVVTYTRLMYWYGKAGDMDRALSVFDQMKAVDCKPNIVTYTTLMHLHSKDRKFSKIREVYLAMVDSGQQPNSATYTVLINCLVNMENLDSALLVFNSMEKLEAIPTFVTYGLLMNAFAKAGKLPVLWGLYEKLQNSGLWLNQKNYSSLVDSLHAAGKLEEADDLIKKIGFILEKEENPTKFFLHTMAEETSEEEYGLQEVLRAFDGQFVDKELEDPFGACLFTPYTEEQDFVRANVDIRALCGVLLNWDDKTAEALDVANIKWDWRNVLRMLMALKSGDVTWKFFTWVIGKQGYKHNVYTYSKMIDILARHGNFKNAQVLLEEMQDKKLPVSVVTFNTLISFLSAAGRLTEALKLFYWMKESDVAPNKSTFTLLIDMFAKHKRNDKALEMYKRMLEAGLRPDTSTYSSFIKSLAEEGKVEAAYSIFQKMQEFACHPDLTIYTALIDAFYKKENMGKTLEVFTATQDSGMELLPASYRLVAKAFKRVGNMEEANRIREDMNLLRSPNQKRVDSITAKAVQNTILEALLKEEISKCYTCSNS
ncbi:hypothetical protein O6H91_13G072200 [Diphasiastrum complanatum]|uniref:Uncharacterized protein n=1 Tax=Diphasiastrum complanatum TaxID=34168 RepID=A0ACC2BW53_DIPCM|nr:hypothetical protein O6H91_13G072200 [Diphasiastrum complanatum]